MTLFSRAAACAVFLGSSLLVMTTGTQSMAAMLTPEAVTATTDEAPTAAVLDGAVQTASATIFVSHPVVQPTEQSDAVEPAADTAELFATLRDAVDDHRDDEGLNAEERCMAVAVFYESKGEPLKGQMAVAHVILNRVGSARFPNSVCGVVTQRSQFSFVRGGRLPTARAGGQWETAKAVARAAMADDWDSPVGRAMYFHAARVSPRWNRVQVATVGNHVFYR